MVDAVKEEFLNFKDELLRDKKKLVKVLLIVCILLITVFLKITQSSEGVVIDENVSETEGAAVSEMYVDIDGAVQKPGVYQVQAGTRLYEVIDQAGGLTDEADTDSINRAEFIEDGQKITIPAISAQGDEDSADTSSGGNESSVAKSSGLININTASKEELKQITGVGDAIADRIIDYRSSTKFKKIEDIMEVRGIGDATFEKMKSQITV